MTATLIPVTDLKVGDQIAGATVQAVRTTKSGKTVKITIPSAVNPGQPFEFSQAANTQIAVFNR
jgi:hypothetical protein